MDRIKPVDLERARFRKAFRGYDRDEVEELLSRVSCELETLLRELRQAQDENERLKGEIEGFRAQENTLKEALLLAQKMAEETRATAYLQAESIIGETRTEADKLSDTLQTKINDLRWELERLRLEKQKFLDRFRATLEEYLHEVTEAQNSEGRKDEPNDPDAPTIRVV
jgi:cell division initiation protein